MYTHHDGVAAGIGFFSLPLPLSFRLFCAPPHWINQRGFFFLSLSLRFLWFLFARLRIDYFPSFRFSLFCNLISSTDAAPFGRLVGTDETMPDGKDSWLPFSFSSPYIYTYKYYLFYWLLRTVLLSIACFFFFLRHQSEEETNRKKTWWYLITRLYSPSLARSTSSGRQSQKAHLHIIGCWRGKKRGRILLKRWTGRGMQSRRHCPKWPTGIE